MLCVTLQGRTRACAGVTGGVSRIWVADPADFNFTQTAPTDPYSAVTLRTGATTAGGAKFFEITFNDDEASYKFNHSRKGCSVKWEHNLEAQLPQLNQSLTVFLMSMDAAGCCCGLLFIIEMNDGTIFVAGEKYVNGGVIPKFSMKMEGTTADTGKVFDDFNGANVIFKGTYSRPPFEFSGGAAAIEALAA